MTVSAAPLLDLLPATRQGRPSQRPAGMPADLWKDFCRAQRREGRPLVFRSFHRRHRSISRNLQMRWGFLLQNRPRQEFSTGRWEIMIHRKDLTREDEQFWTRRIANEDAIGKRYRVTVRGVWHLVAVGPGGVE